MLTFLTPKAQLIQEYRELDRNTFLNYVLRDHSVEPLMLVHNVKTGSYIGPVVTQPKLFLIHLKHIGFAVDSNLKEVGLQLLLRGDTIPMDIEWHRTYGYQFPRSDCWVFKYRKKSTKRILRYFFDDNYEIKRVLTAEEEAALIVILFERNLPYRISGYGSGLDWSRLNWEEF